MSADKKDQALHKQMSVFMWYISQTWSTYFVVNSKVQVWHKEILKGKSVVAAILTSCMEGSYCTSEFFS